MRIERYNEVTDEFRLIAEAEIGSAGTSGSANGGFSLVTDKPQTVLTPMPRIDFLSIELTVEEVEFLHELMGDFLKARKAITEKAD